MYGPLRLLYDLPSRRKKGRPEALTLKVKLTAESDWEYIPVTQDRYPFLITFPYLGMPRLLAGEPRSSAPGAVTSRLWIRGASPHYDFHVLLKQLLGELSINAVMPESRADVAAFCRLLAKIAHSFATAELGQHGFESTVTSYVSGADLSHCLYYIGSGDRDEHPTDSLHELTILNGPLGAPLVVRVRLLAKLGTPTYYVVVAESRRRASPSIELNPDAR